MCPRSVQCHTLDCRATLLSSHERVAVWAAHGLQSSSAWRMEPQCSAGAEARIPGEGLESGAQPHPRWAGPGELRGLTGCSMTLSTVRLMSAMASVYTAASSWISLWFWGRRAR